MPTISVLVVPEVVRNKPETERNHTVTGVAKGWEKTSLNQDPNEILTECKGLDALLTKSNLEADGTTKVDDTKPVGFEVSYEIHDTAYKATTGVSITPTTVVGKVGDIVDFAATVAPADATYQGVNWYPKDPTQAKHVGGGSFELLAAGNAVVYAVTVEGAHSASATITIQNADGTDPLSLTTDLPATKTAAEDTDATFTIVAAGGNTPYTYSWFYSDTPGGAGAVIDAGVNPTAATASLVNHSVTPASEGEYWCVVKDASNNTISSTRCELTVN